MNSSSSKYTQNSQQQSLSTDFLHKVVLFLLCIFGITLSMPNYALAQDDEDINTVGYRFLDYKSGYLPKDLLTTKSVVFISMPPKAKNTSERGNWKVLAEKAHTYFSAMGIDPVKYYYIDDVFASDDISSAVAQEMTKREVSNVIVFSHVRAKIKEKEIERYVLVITPFSKNNNFMTNGAEAWKDQNSDADKVLKKLTKTVNKSGLKKENLMILDKPEYFTQVKFVRGGRNESFNTDVRIDKLAIPLFADVDIPSSIPGGTINNRVKKEAELYNRTNTRLNSELEQMFSNYPYEFGFVQPGIEPEKLRMQGYQYVLKYVKASGRSVKSLLGYEEVDGDSDLVTIKQTAAGTTIFRSIPPDAPVYKYYIEQLYTGDVYLGVQWDADETWKEALENHLYFLTKALEKK